MQKTSLGLLAGGHKPKWTWQKEPSLLPTPVSKALKGIPEAGEKEDPEENQLQSYSAPRQNKKENMEEVLHSICSSSRDLSATWWLLCFRGVCFGTFLPMTRPALPPFLYSYLPLESQILLRIGLSVLYHCLFPPHCCTQAWKETSQLFIPDGFFIIVGVQSKWSVFSWSCVLNKRHAQTLRCNRCLSFLILIFFLLLWGAPTVYK